MEYQIMKNMSKGTMDIDRALSDLTKTVNAEINKGWVPVGGITIVEGNRTILFLQAMTKQ